MTRVKWQTNSSIKNMARLRQILKESPQLNLKEVAEQMAKEGCTMKGGAPVNHSAIKWLAKKMRRPRGVIATPMVRQNELIHVPVTGKSDKMELITIVMAARVPDAAKLKIIQVLANVP